MTTLIEHTGVDFPTLLAVPLGDGRPIASVSCRANENRSSFFIEDIEIAFDDGTTVELVAKATDWGALSPEARRAKPVFLLDADREWTTYEALLSPLNVATARFRGSYVTGTGTRYLLLDRVGGRPLWQHGDFDAWREAARWLARMHARVGRERALCSRAARHLLRYDRRYYDRWVARARAFHGDSSAQLLSLLARHSRLAEWLLAEPVAFIHGEFYPSNVLVADGESDPRFVVTPVDWEMAGLGPALMDLAFLLAGQWTDDDRADVADVYFAERSTLGHRVPERSDYLRTLDFCLIHLSVRNLGWSRDWTPPPDRTYDWLGEAARLCERWHL